MYNRRSYRNWVEGQDLVSFVVKIGSSDLFIRAEKILTAQAKACLRIQRQLIEDYLNYDPGFATALEPYKIKDTAAEIIQKMSQAAGAAGVGPMAAVAGAIAEYVGQELLKYSTQVIVENGGDIFMKTGRSRKIGIFAGSSCYGQKLALELGPNRNNWGICTSSGRVGPSLSLGQADAAVVISHSAILADAWATRLGNIVKSADDVDTALNLAQQTAEIKGAVIIIGKKIGAWGDIRLVKI